MSTPEPVHGVEVRVTVHAVGQDIQVNRTYDDLHTAKGDLATMFDQLIHLLCGPPKGGSDR